MPQSVYQRLYAEATGLIYGSQDLVTFYHMLMEQGGAVAPDIAEIEFITNPTQTVSGAVGGHPTAIMLQRTATLVQWRVRGLRTREGALMRPDQVQFRVRAMRLSGLARAELSAKLTGTDLAGAGGSAVVTSATGGFVAAKIVPGDTIVINVGPTGNSTVNGRYTVLTRDSATQLTLTAAVSGSNPFTDGTFAINGPLAIIGKGSGVTPEPPVGGTFEQIPFHLPSDDAYAGGTTATMNAELPSAAIQPGEFNLNQNSLLRGGAGNVAEAFGPMTANEVLRATGAGVPDVGLIIDANVAAAAALAVSKLEVPAAGEVIVGNAGGAFERVAMSGDIGMAGGGGTTIQDNAVSGNKIANLGVAAGKYAAGSIVNADVNAAADIAGSKLANASVTAAKLDTPETAFSLHMTLPDLVAAGPAVDSIIDLPDCIIDQIETGCTSSDAGALVDLLVNGAGGVSLLGGAQAIFQVAGGTGVFVLLAAARVPGGTPLTLELTPGGAANTVEPTITIHGRILTDTRNAQAKFEIAVNPADTPAGVRDVIFQSTQDFFLDQINAFCQLTGGPGDNFDILVAAASILAGGVPQALVPTENTPALLAAGPGVAVTSAQPVTFRTIVGVGPITGAQYTLRGRWTCSATQSRDTIVGTFGDGAGVAQTRYASYDTDVSLTSVRASCSAAAGGDTIAVEYYAPAPPAWVLWDTLTLPPGGGVVNSTAAPVTVVAGAGIRFTMPGTAGTNDATYMSTVTKNLV